MSFQGDPDEVFKTEALSRDSGTDSAFFRFSTCCNQASWKIGLKRRESPQRDVRKMTSEAGMLFKIKEIGNDTFWHPDEWLKTRELSEKAHEWFRMRRIEGICG
jgi:hypothetical protein